MKKIDSDKLTKLIKKSQIPGLSKATVFALMTQCQIAEPPTVRETGPAPESDVFHGTGKKPDGVEAVLDELTFLFAKEPMQYELGPYFDGYEDCKGNVLNHIKEIRDKIKKEYEP